MTSKQNNIRTWNVVSEHSKQSITWQPKIRLYKLEMISVRVHLNPTIWNPRPKEIMPSEHELDTESAE